MIGEAILAATDGILNSSALARLTVIAASFPLGETRTRLGIPFSFFVLATVILFALRDSSDGGRRWVVLAVGTPVS